MDLRHDPLEARAANLLPLRGRQRVIFSPSQQTQHDPRDRGLIAPHESILKKFDHTSPSPQILLQAPRQRLARRRRNSSLSPQILLQAPRQRLAGGGRNVRAPLGRRLRLREGAGEARQHGGHFRRRAHRYYLYYGRARHGRRQGDRHRRRPRSVAGAPEPRGRPQSGHGGHGQGVLPEHRGAAKKREPR